MVNKNEKRNIEERLKEIVREKTILFNIGNLRTPRDELRYNYLVSNEVVLRERLKRIENLMQRSQQSQATTRKR